LLGGGSGAVATEPVQAGTGLFGGMEMAGGTTAAPAAGSGGLFGGMQVASGSSGAAGVPPNVGGLGGLFGGMQVAGVAPVSQEPAVLSSGGMFGGMQMSGQPPPAQAVPAAGVAPQATGLASSNLLDGLFGGPTSAPVATTQAPPATQDLLSLDPLMGASASSTAPMMAPMMAPMQPLQPGLAGIQSLNPSTGSPSTSKFSFIGNKAPANSGSPGASMLGSVSMPPAQSGLGGFTMPQQPSSTGAAPAPAGTGSVFGQPLPAGSEPKTSAFNFVKAKKASDPFSFVSQEIASSKK